MNPIAKETMTNLQNTVKRLGIIVFRCVLLLIIRATFWSSYCEIRAQPHCRPKYGPFSKHCQRPFIHRFPLLYLCVSCKQHFGVLPVKFLLNQITTHKMASLENIVTSLRIIVLCYSYSAYHQNDSLELLPWNCHLAHYDARVGRFAKFCHTPQTHRFNLVIWCLSSERHIGALTVKLSLNPIMTQKMADLQNSVTRFWIIVFI